MLADLTTSLATELAIDAPQEDGAISFTINRDLEIEIAPLEDDEFIVSAPVTPLPATGSVELYASLLSRSAYGRETGGAAFGIDAERGMLVLWRQMSARDLPFESFAIALSEFLESLTDWRARGLPA